MAETHFWAGSKPLKRYNVSSWGAYDEIGFGQAFVPTSDELLAFGDKISPVADGPPEPPPPPQNSSLRTGPDGQWTRRGGRLSR